MTVNGEGYRNMISTFFESQHEAGHLRNIWYQQDGTTSHTARETRILLNRLFSQKLISRHGDVNWPPRSPDLTLPDFYLWGYIKEKFTSINQTQSLNLRETSKKKSGKLTATN